MSCPAVVLADDDHDVRESLRAVLDRASGIKVVAETGTGREAIREAARHRPDVLLIDPCAGGRDGFLTMAEVVRSAPGTAVLVFTRAQDGGAVRAALRAGARGYLLKPASPDRIIEAIGSAAAGTAVFDAAVAVAVTELLTGPPHPIARLSPRQREVLALVAEGLPNGAVARRLQLAPKTVRNHVSTLFAALEVPDRAQAILVARDAGLTVPVRT